METKLFIHGKNVDAANGKTFESINPATQEVFSQVSYASEEDIEKTIESAKKGYEIWSKMLPVERSRILHKAAKILREQNDELALLEVQDTGKPMQEANCVDIASGADCIEYYANLGASLHGEQHDLANAFAYTRREPLGICVGIGAWNYPIQIACWKSAPALACGNVMIFKPSEVTPVTANKLAEVYKEAGLPDGVFNVIHGDGVVGKLLTEHKDVAKVSLTGSVETGKKVMLSAAKSLKKVTMELGGKSPLIIFDDADIDNAVSAAMLANFYTQGEICSNGTRVFVHESVKEQFLSQLKQRTESLVIGNPIDLKTQVGSMIHPEHADKVLSYIAKGKEEGATLLTGGEKVEVEGCAGSFISPAIFVDCHDDMVIAKEEIFGPVMAVLTFSDEMDVIQRANNIEEGLAAGVFTQNIKRAHKVVNQLQAGICWINNYNITPIEIPFGGYKASGIGRENGIVTLDHYTQIKSVYVELGDVDCPY